MKEHKQSSHGKKGGTAVVPLRLILLLLPGRPVILLYPWSQVAWFWFGSYVFTLPDVLQPHQKRLKVKPGVGKKKGKGTTQQLQTLNARCLLIYFVP